MTGRSFWIISFALLAAASHLAYVLFTPGVDSEALYQNLVAVTGNNKLKSLSVQQAGQLSASSDNKLVHAVCAYDLSRGPVRLTARFPDSYWSVNIYTTHGDVIYTLNDRQANASTLSIVISASSANVEATAAPTPGQTQSGEIQVISDDMRGLAVLRGSMINERQRKRIAATLSRSDCRSESS